MPLPNSWAAGVAAPSYADPYRALEGGPPGGIAAGEVPAPPSRAHWSEILDWHGSPAIWILVALLLVVGIMHFSAGGRVGPAKAGIEV
jgi:hypothetical protein